MNKARTAPALCCTGFIHNAPSPAHNPGQTYSNMILPRHIFVLYDSENVTAERFKASDGT
jgi:hypothetical protein